MRPGIALLIAAALVAIRPATASASLISAHSHWDVRNADHELLICYTVTGSISGAGDLIAFVTLREEDAKNFMQLGITRTGFELKRRDAGTSTVVTPLAATPEPHGSPGQEIMFDYVEQGADFYVYALGQGLVRGELLYHWRDATYPEGVNISYYTRPQWAGVWDFVHGRPLDGVGMPHDVGHLVQDARNHPSVTGAPTSDDPTPANGGVSQITNEDTSTPQFGLASGSDYRYDATVSGSGSGYMDFRDPGDTSNERFFRHGWYRLNVPSDGDASIQRFAGAGTLVATHMASAGGPGGYSLEMHGHAFTLAKAGTRILAFTDSGPTSGLRVRVVPRTQTWSFVGSVL